MAEILGFPDDAIHWNSTVGMDNIQHNLENQWELDTEGMYGSTKNGMGWTNIAPAGGMHMFFPRYLQLRAKQMAHLVDKHYQNEVTLTGQNPPLNAASLLRF